MTIPHRHTALLILAALLLAAALAPGTAFAEGFAGHAGAFLRMGSGAAALGTGDTGAARAFGAEQAYYNPAGLPHAPANDVYIGYHVLSLDRRLGHVGTLIQVPELRFWRDPIRPVALVEQDNGRYTLAAEEDLSPAKKRDMVDIDEYLQPLAASILRAAREMELDERPSMRLAGREVDPGVLMPVIDAMAADARDAGVDDETAVIDMLEDRYQRVQQKPAAVSLNWTHAGTGNIDGRTTSGVHYGELGFYENRFSFSFGLRLHRALSAGVTVGVLYAIIPDLIDENESLSSTTFGADAGLQLRPFRELEMPYRLHTLALGAVAYDLGGKHSWNSTGYWDQGTSKTDEFPRRYRAGLAYAPLRGLTLAADWETNLDDVNRLKAGAELYVIGADRYAEPEGGPLDGGLTRSLPGKPALILRGGIDDDSPTFGLGLVLHVAGLGLTRLDYAYVVEDVSPEPTQVLTWRFRFAL